MSGLDPTGLTIESLQEIRDAINQDLRGAFGASIDLSDKSAFGQIVGIFSERISLLWELVEAVYSSQDPDKATKAALVALCALTGTIKEPAASSKVTLTLTGDNATAVTTGSQASTSSTGKKFETLEDKTLATLSAWTALTAYAIGARVTNDDGGTDRAYLCIAGGVSAASGGPTGTGTSIVDSGVTWRYLGNGTAAADAKAQSVDTGPIVATSGDINTIETPVAGWLGVINILDADKGTDEETDPHLRIRREEELAGGGATTADALRTALLNVNGVSAVTLFVNSTGMTDADGVPGHAIESLITGGEDQDIWDALLANVAAGIQTWGDEIGTALDSESNEQEERFSRPDEVPIYADLDVLVNAKLFPGDGAIQIKQAITDWGDAQATGKDAVAAAISAQAFKVAGVLDVTDIDIGTAPSPSGSTTIAISPRQLATYDSSRLNIIVTPGTP